MQNHSGVDTQGRLDPAERFLLAELVRDGDDEGFGHFSAHAYGVTFDDRTNGRR
jgi:hypothetical protein